MKNNLLKNKLFTRVRVVQGPSELASFAIQGLFEKLYNCLTNSSPQILVIISNRNFEW